jgi:hypothetical protein
MSLVTRVNDVLCLERDPCCKKIVKENINIEQKLHLLPHVSLAPSGIVPIRITNVARVIKEVPTKHVVNILDNLCEKIYFYPPSLTSDSFI